MLGDDLLERLRIGHASPVSRTVMLTRPGGRSSRPGAVPSSTFGTPWMDAPVPAPEHEKIAGSELDVRERPGAPIDAREAEDAGVAEADGDDRCRRRLLTVLVQAEMGARRCSS